MVSAMYRPSDELLEKYADVLVNFALHSGEGVRKGEVVQCVVPDVAKPMYGMLMKKILEAGAHPLMRFIATGFDRSFYDLADDDQLEFFPKNYIRSRVRLIDHSIGIIAEHDLHELNGVSPQKIIKSAESKKNYRKWLNDKEYAGNFTWTLGLYGTEAMAKEAGMSLEEYWGEIIKACFLDSNNPRNAWQKIIAQQKQVIGKLNSLSIKRIHVEAEGTDLWITLGKKRRWVGGECRNIPSFEIFTSPDWRGTEGKITFNQPLYRYGSLIDGIVLEFKKGKVTKATATKNQKLLLELIARPDADKVGEFSLTDRRFSPITKFMANTLFDENVGGPYGNTHIAVGMSYKDTYDGDVKAVKKAEWRQLGFNDSGEHCDIMSTTDRVVTAVLVNGKEKVIYKDGVFVE
jgi:aminopeptidase